MTPDSIRKWLAVNEYRMDLPVQYMGNEPNALCRDWDATTLRWLIAASWPYEHAAGNQSIPAVCKSVTDASPLYLCDRFYLPATPRDLRMLEKGGVPVFGIESKHELLDFDVVGTSISYLVLFMNYCKMLKMSGIPLRWKDRESNLGDYPMVLIGGQAYSAPAAMEPVADCIWLGEVETEPGNGGMAHVCRRIQQFKDDGWWINSRTACYKELAREFSYLHFPRFVQTFYRYEDRGLEKPSKQVSGYASELPGMTFPRRARKVQNMDMIAPLDKAPLLYADPALGAGDLEVARGCPAWCGFCRLSWLTKPYRQRTVAKSVEHAAAWHRNMGAVELSPFSPDFPMHTQRKLLIAELLQKVNDEADSVAMRVDDFIADGDYILLQAVGGMDAVTLGLEGNSQRMRDLVGKGTSDADVIEAVVRGIRAGIRKFKLFMITNLPGEEPEDVMRIVSLAYKLADVRDQMNQPNVRIQFSWTPLLIEAGTPFQWFAPTSADHTLIRVAEQFRDLKIDFKVGTKAEPNKVTFFQLCQRASADAGEAVVDVIDDLDIACWGGVPRDMRDRLDAALRARGFANGLADCFDERYENDLFGWEYLDTGVAKGLMWGVYRQMVEFLENTTAASYDAGYDERYHGSEWVGRCDTHCMGRSCGACSPADLKLRAGYVRAAQHDLDVDLAALHPVDQSSIAMKVRIPLDYSRRYRFVGNDHWRFSLRRAAYLAADTMSATLPDGFSIAKRSIRFATDGLDSRGTSGRDYAEFGLTRQIEEDTLRVFLDGMRSYLSKWVTLDDGWLIVPATADLRRDSALALYRLTLQDDPDLVLHRLAAWDNAESVRLVLRQDTAYFGIASEEVNAKDYVSDMWVTSDNGPLALRMLTRGLAGPYQLYAALMGKASWIEATSREALRSAIFTPDSTGQAALQGDLLTPACVGCGMMIPVTVLGKPWRFDYCPRCTSESQGRVYGGLERVPV